MATRAAWGEELEGAQAARLSADLKAALRRKPAQEGRLGGVVRSLLPHSASLVDAAAESLAILVRRGSFARPLYAALARGLAEVDAPGVVPAFRDALLADESGGLATLSAACLCRHPGLAEPLARAVLNRHPHLVFAAEVARVARGESTGEHIASVAPKIKESHRLDLCAEVLVPLLWAEPLPPGIAPALSVLRDSERHLGRWLVLGVLATRAGDPQPLAEARERAEDGPGSARAAWAMVAWALSDGSEAPPEVRPTVELVARLSDRPSSDKDLTFLYRLAASRATSAKNMLEGVAKGSALSSEAAVRAALYLARDHERGDLASALERVAESPRREPLRGLATAALYDLGRHERARELAAGAGGSKHLSTSAWAALVARADGAPVLTEPRFRRVQLGWPE
ncbi:MAG: hypothetical protein R3B13_22755 [Polyangiaceae bacterium]